MGGPRQLDEALSVRDGTVYVEGCSTEALAERFGTPLYVVSEDQLRRNLNRFREAFEPRWQGEFLLLPSIKANSCLALRRVLTIEGAGCDTFGASELDAALRAGTDPDRVSLNGAIKDDALLERAVRAGVRITLDSVAELHRAAAAAERLRRRARVRFRLRPDLPSEDAPSEMSPSGVSIRDAIQRYKAGIPSEDVLALDASAIADSRLEVSGLMFHLGRHSAEPAVWTAGVDWLAGMVERLRIAWDGWVPAELDVGGGFPAPRDPFGRSLPQRAGAPPTSPGADAFAEAICGPLEERLGGLGIDPAGVRLEVEPGRAVYADAGVHLARVGNVKRQTEPTPRTWVETDSSDAYLADVNLEFNRWTCLVSGRADADAAIVADVTGRTCALDVIVPDAELPPVESGDLLVFLDTGAYQDASASNFNALPRPGTALVLGGSAEMIRRHETIEDVYGRDLIPERLRDGAAIGDGHAGWRATGLDHVAVTSGDLDRSLRFYVDLLGLPLRARGDGFGAAELEITGIDASEVRWADLELASGQVLELIEYVDPRGTPSRPEANDPGATHISLRVPDVEAAYERLRDTGVPVRSRPVTLTDPGAWRGARCFYAADPDGVTVELIQGAP